MTRAWTAFACIVLTLTSTAGYWAGTARTIAAEDEAARQAAVAHGERDAVIETRCAVGVMWANRWHGAAMTAVRAQVGGPFQTTGGGT